MNLLSSLFKKKHEKMLGRGESGSSVDESSPKSKKSWAPEEVTSAMEGGSTAIRAILESLEPTDFFSSHEVAKLVGGHSDPSCVYGPDGRSASSSILGPGHIASHLKKFWDTGRMFDNIDDSVPITQRYAEVTERFVRITLETNSKDNRVAVAFKGMCRDGRTAFDCAMICYLEDSGS